MKYALDTAFLTKQLRSAPERELPDYVGELNEISTGAAYLFRFCILPLLYDQIPVLSKIEADRFAPEDIGIMIDFFCEKKEEQDRGLIPVSEISNAMRSASPKPVSVGFI